MGRTDRLTQMSGWSCWYSLSESLNVISVWKQGSLPAEKGAHSHFRYSELPWRSPNQRKTQLPVWDLSRVHLVWLTMALLISQKWQYPKKAFLIPESSLCLEATRKILWFRKCTSREIVASLSGWQMKLYRNVYQYQYHIL